MDSGTAKERAEGEEGKMSDFGEIDPTKPFSFTERLRLTCAKNIQFAENDRSFFAKAEREFEQLGKDNDKFGERSNDELKKQYFYSQAQVFRLLGIISQMTEALLSGEERLWRMHWFVLDAFQHDVLNTSEDTRKEFIEELEQLQSKYDVSHNGILEYLEQVKKTNPWFQKQGGKKA